MCATEEANTSKREEGQDRGRQEPVDSLAQPAGTRDLLLAVMALTVAGLRTSALWSDRPGKEARRAAHVH